MLTVRCSQRLGHPIRHGRAVPGRSLADLRVLVVVHGDLPPPTLAHNHEPSANLGKPRPYRCHAGFLQSFACDATGCVGIRGGVSKGGSRSQGLVLVVLAAAVMMSPGMPAHAQADGRDPRDAADGTCRADGVNGGMVDEGEGSGGYRCPADAVYEEGSRAYAITIVRDPLTGQYRVVGNQPATQTPSDGPLAGLTVTHLGPMSEDVALSQVEEFDCLYTPDGNPDVQRLWVEPSRETMRNVRYDWWIHPFIFDDYDKETGQKLLVACTAGGTRATRSGWYLWYGGVAVAYPDATGDRMATMPAFGTGTDLALVQATLSLKVGDLGASVSQKAVGVNGGAPGSTPRAALTQRFGDNSAYAYWQRAGLSPGSDSFQGQVLHSAWLLDKNEDVMTPVIEPFWRHWCPGWFGPTWMGCLTAPERPV